MYYFVCFSIYFFIIAILLLYTRKPHKAEKQKFFSVFMTESLKGLTKSDSRSRKKRGKGLPLWQRFLYKFWFYGQASMLLVFPVLLNVIRYNLICAFFIPADTPYYFLSDGSEIAFGVGSFLCGVLVLLCYSYLTNRGVIRKADLIYHLGSFQEYPKKMNFLIGTVLFAVGMPLMIMSFNSYTYIKADSIIIKTSFSVAEKHYSFNDLDYIERDIDSDGEVDYDAYFKNKKRYTIYRNCPSDIEFEEMLKRNNICIKDKP